MATVIVKSGSTVQLCGCAHAEQDRLHGKNKRVHNRCQKGARCTVCGSEKPAQDGG